MKELEQFKLFAAQLAKESGAIIRSYFRTSIAVDSKSDSSPVTIADKKAEDKMREIIMSEFPQHGIIERTREAGHPAQPLAKCGITSVSRPAFQILSRRRHSRPAAEPLQNIIIGKVGVGFTGGFHLPQESSVQEFYAFVIKGAQNVLRSRC